MFRENVALKSENIQLKFNEKRLPICERLLEDTARRLQTSHKEYRKLEGELKDRIAALDKRDMELIAAKEEMLKTMASEHALRCERNHIQSELSLIRQRLMEVDDERRRLRHLDRSVSKHLPARTSSVTSSDASTVGMAKTAKNKDVNTGPGVSVSRSLSSLNSAQLADAHSKEQFRASFDSFTRAMENEGKRASSTQVSSSSSRSNKGVHWAGIGTEKVDQGEVSNVDAGPRGWHMPPKPIRSASPELISHSKGKDRYSPVDSVDINGNGDHLSSRRTRNDSRNGNENSAVFTGIGVDSTHGQMMAGLSDAPYPRYLSSLLLTTDNLVLHLLT